MKKDMLDLEDFDFGFAIVDEQELDTYKAVTEEKDRAASNAEEWRRKAHAIRDAVEPLLQNFCRDSEKEYIWWPNRVEKIKEFRRKLDSLLGGE